MTVATVSNPTEATPRCLVVEDDPVVSRLLAGRMGLEGYQVRTVGDGADVMHEVADWHPDIILLDLMIPSVSGIDICRHLKAEGSPTREIPVVVVSAYSSPDNRRRVSEAGADAFFGKPFNATSLSESIRHLVHEQRNGAA